MDVFDRIAYRVIKRLEDQKPDKRNEKAFREEILVGEIRKEGFVTESDISFARQEVTRAARRIRERDAERRSA